MSREALGSRRPVHGIKGDIQKDVEKAQEVLNDNVPICCPIITISASYEALPWAQYQAIVAGGDRPGSMEVLPGPLESVTTSNDGNKDLFTPNDRLKELLKKCRSANCVPVYYVPKMQLKKGRRWKKLDGATVSPKDSPETTTADDSGVGIVIHQGLDVDKGTLVHELGHLLIDLPRGQDEHVGNGRAVRKRVMKTNPPHGDEFPKEECSRIFDNIGNYGGA